MDKQQICQRALAYLIRYCGRDFLCKWIKENFSEICDREEICEWIKENFTEACDSEEICRWIKENFTEICDRREVCEWIKENFPRVCDKEEICRWAKENLVDICGKDFICEWAKELCKFEYEIQELDGVFRGPGGGYWNRIYFEDINTIGDYKRVLFKTIRIDQPNTKVIVLIYGLAVSLWLSCDVFWKIEVDGNEVWKGRLADLGERRVKPIGAMETLEFEDEGSYNIGVYIGAFRDGRPWEDCLGYAHAKIFLPKRES